ncbi:MAG: tetratricopeptide repeat protein, partial [Synechococcaceae cyanobacterium]
MAFTRPAGRLHWLLIGPLLLQSALPVVALEAAGKESDCTPETFLAQAPGTAAAGIPKKVHEWFDAAKAAAAKCDSAEALRLQKQVVGWLEAHPQAPKLFRAQALLNLGSFISDVPKLSAALPPTEQAVTILRQVEASRSEAKSILALALSNLGVLSRQLARPQEALALTEEAVKILRDVAKTKPANQGDLARSLINLSKALSELDRHQEALATMEEAVKIFRELSKANKVWLGYLRQWLSILSEKYSNLGRYQEALA